MPRLNLFPAGIPYYINMHAVRNDLCRAGNDLHSFHIQAPVGLGQPPFWPLSPLWKYPSASMSDFKKDKDE